VIECWTTPEEITTVRDRLEAALGRQRPATYGIGYVDTRYVGEDGDDEPMYEEVPGEVTFMRIDAGQHHLPAVILGTVVGYRGGSGSYRMTRADLDRAIELLTPAKACKEYDHPDLRVWRTLQEMLWSDGEVVAVFAGDLHGVSDDPHVNRLLEVAASGRQDVCEGRTRWWIPESAGDLTSMIELWEQRWPGCQPVAHELKSTFPQRWVRFHSLPGSKRYADTPDEYKVLLNRHNTVLHELRGDPDLSVDHIDSTSRDRSHVPEIVVITCEVGSRPMATDRDPKSSAVLPAASLWASIPWHGCDPDLLFAHLHVSRLPWRPGVLDDLLTSVADAEIGGVIIAPPDLRWLYHPYDGGADVLLPTGALRGRFEHRHREWLSTQPSGL
jgi:hypothetical protein